MRRFSALLLPFALNACAGDQGVSAFVDPDSTWRLSELNGTPFTANATLAFPKPGQISGRGPCNSFSAQQSAPYPWFEITSIVATETACDQLPAERQFFDALGEAAIAEVSGTTLILSSESGMEMVFNRQ